MTNAIQYPIHKGASIDWKMFGASYFDHICRYSASLSSAREVFLDLQKMLNMSSLKDKHTRAARIAMT